MVSILRSSNIELSVSFSSLIIVNFIAGSVFSSSIPTLGPIFEDKSMGQRYLMGEYIGLETSTVPSTSATPRRVQFSVPSSEEDWRDSAERRTRLLSVGEESGDAGQASCLKPARVRRSSNQPVTFISPLIHYLPPYSILASLFLMPPCSYLPPY